jgi:ribosomal protein L11 methylase PrmA
MTEVQAVPGSFRDPSGRIFIKEGRVFRTVSASAAADFDAVSETGFLDELIETGQLLPWTEATGIDLGPETGTAQKILETERLGFISYPYEWSFSGLRAAALLHLDIQIKGLKRGVALSDASAYNVQFRGSRPVFIDHLSFRPYREGEIWRGHWQFCDQFLNPLLLRAKLGIPHNDWYRGALEGIASATLASLLPWYARLSPRTLAHVLLPARFDHWGKNLDNKTVSASVSGAELPKRSLENMLRGLSRWIESLKPKGVDTTTWADYAKTHNYGNREIESKQGFVADFTDGVRPAQLWDLGCNTGDFSEIALKAGAASVVGFENDHGALEKAFHRARIQDLAFLPLYLDAANPSPAQGWSQRERDGMAQRCGADALLALAVLHHLCIGRNIPLPEAVSWLVSLAPRGVIEFVPKHDPMVLQLLALREDVFEEYTDEVFDRALVAEARVVHEDTITDGGRRLIHYERT